jgi:hypothetical protein
VDRIEITECGIYRLSNRTARDAPGTASGTMQSSDGKLLASTATIPARDGLSFGYTYRIIGRPRDTSVTLRDINIVPAPGAQRADRQRDVSGGGDRPQEHGHLHRFDYMLDK